jgi:hypothetical protein
MPHMNEDHLTVAHNIVGQIMLRYDNTVPAAGRSISNGAAAVIPAAGGQPARRRVFHQLTGAVGAWGWCLTCIMPAAGEHTRIFHEQGIRSPMYRELAFECNCNRRW